VYPLGFPRSIFNSSAIFFQLASSAMAMAFLPFSSVCSPIGG
jgi:hypothetical protein